MNPLERLKKVAEVAVRAGDNALQARETRGKSAAFQAEMVRENAEFMNVLTDLGSNTFDAGVDIVLKTPTTLFLNALKVLYSKNYSMKDWGKDALRSFFDKNGTAHRTIKVAANAIHLAGQGAKIGIRQLFKV